MEEKEHNSQEYVFAEFRLLAASERVLRYDEPLKTEPQLYALLWLFVQHPGVIISRQTIEQEVWGGRPVSDEALRAALKKLRDLLHDNARSPRFIKTIPKQGYKWLAPISVEQNHAGHMGSLWNTQKNIKIGGALLLAAAIVVAMWVYAPLTDKRTAPSSEQPAITRLTRLTGSEVDASYHAGHNKLAFLHRDARHSPQQLYIKSLTDGVVQRLSWDNANYSNSAWSHDGKRLAFMRLIDQQSSLHIAHFDNAGQVERLDTITSPALDNKYVNAWLHDDTGLLLAENLRPDTQHRIYAFDLETEALQALTNPNVAARGDFKASLSPDGRHLAILREEVAQEASLLITSLADGNLLAKFTLPFIPSRLVWTPDSNTVAVSNFFGDHGRYDLSTKAFTEQPALPEHSLDLFASCGQRCYVLRQHNGNFLDLQEAPMASLMRQPDAGQSGPIVGGGRLLRRAGAQDFPQYLGNQRGVFLVSLEGRDFVFQWLDADNQLHNLATLNYHAPLDSVSASPDAKHFVGVSGGRLFSASLEAQQSAPVTFLTSAMERFENPIWHSDGQQLYVARITANRPSIVTFDLASQQLSPVIDDLVAMAERPGMPDEAIGITPSLSVVRLVNSSGQWRRADNLGQVASANPNRWRLTDDALYYTRYELPEAFLCRLSLSSGDGSEPRCWSIGSNRFRLHFDIDDATQNIMLVESLSAESDIVQMTW